MPGFACNGSWSDIRAKSVPTRCTGIWCGTCKKPLCITACFEIFHTDENYEAILLAKRFPPDNVSNLILYIFNRVSKEPMSLVPIDLFCLMLLLKTAVSAMQCNK